MATHPNVIEVAANIPSEHSLLRLARMVWRHRLGRFGVLILSVLIVCAASASLISPYDPIAIDYDALLEPPSMTHWFGTDELGRDILTRVIHGAAASLKVM